MKGPAGCGILKPTLAHVAKSRSLQGCGLPVPAARVLVRGYYFRVATRAGWQAGRSAAPPG